MIINLFGTCLRIWTCLIEIETYRKYQHIMDKHQLDCTSLFTDFDFLEEIGVQHWSDLCLKATQSFFLVESSNHIELRRKGKRVKKINCTDLLENNLLFQLYQTNQVTISFPQKKDHQTLLFIQTEIGVCAKYEIKQEEFSIDSLNFELGELEKLSACHLLCGLEYNKVKLKSKKDDTLVRKIAIVPYF
jgi:hypothetical protein